MTLPMKLLFRLIVGDDMEIILKNVVRKEKKYINTTQFLNELPFR
jgi:hypothetical protein